MTHYGFFFFFFSLDDVERHQGRGPLDPHLRSKPQIDNPTHQNCISGNPGELLVGIKPRTSGSTAHPKPPTTMLHPNGWSIKVLLTQQYDKAIQN